MKYNKADEHWFADSFNRDDTLCSYVTAYDSAISIDGAATSAIATSKGVTGINNISFGDCTYKIQDSRVDDVQSSIARLQAQIDDLKKNYVAKKGADELRLALKTLNYTREL